MIKIKDLSISFNGKELFTDVNIHLNPKEKIGLIGRNGAGKSTFLNLLLKRIEPDTGEVEIARNYQIGFLEQHIKFSHPTIIEEVTSILPEERVYEAWKGEKILNG